MIDATRVRRWEPWLIVAIALHSYLVGILLVFFTDWTLRFAGWGAGEDPFFARQGGVFHMVVATGYLLEWFRHRGVRLMITAKATAVVFLLTLAPSAHVWSVPFSGITDGLMLAAVVATRIMSRRNPAPSP